MQIETRMDYEALLGAADEITKEYPAISRSCVGQSVCGRDIVMLSAGDCRAKKSVLYVGTHHAAEYLTAAVLARFAADLGEAAQAGRKICGVNVGTLIERRRIYMIPMLNPDGVELHLNGIWKDCVLAERLRSMSGGDFSNWQANARGVDLNHNYDALFAEYKFIEAERGIGPGATLYSGTSPESEPETQAICSLLRYDTDVRAVLSLHTQGEVIFYGGDAAPVGARSLGRTLARMTGYTLAETDGTASYGGLTDYFVREYSRPAFTLECGRGENPLPPEQAFHIYARIREALFRFPFLV